MKFYAAVTTEALTLANVSDGDDTKRVFPAGTECSATEAGRPEKWHLNTNGGGGTWDTWEGYADSSQLQLGEVIATANE